ncbi:hypothetical protein C5167_027139 [Papaver somniferum]|nr:hypothetical protein C5167_027139 [Papaver somniferum]
MTFDGISWPSLLNLDECVEKFGIRLEVRVENGNKIPVRLVPRDKVQPQRISLRIVDGLFFHSTLPYSIIQQV